MTQRIRNVVVVGCGFAGTAALRTLGRRLPPGLRVIAFDNKDARYNYPVLPRLLGESLNPAVVEQPLQRLLDGLDITVRQQRVLEVDADQALVRCEQVSQAYDYLLIAPGSRAVPLPQDDGLFVYYPKAWRHLRRLSRHLRDTVHGLAADHAGSSHTHRIAVVGGGRSGIEFAAQIRDAADRRCADVGIARQRIEIRLYEQATRLDPAGPETLSLRLERELARCGIDVWSGCRVDRVSRDGLLTADGTHAADTCVCCIGSRPNLTMALTGLAVDRAGIAVDAALRCPGHETVFCAGDGMRSDADGPVWRDIRQAHRATQQGRRVACNIVRLERGLAARPYRPRERPVAIMLSSGRGLLHYRGLIIGGRTAGRIKRWLDLR